MLNNILTSFLYFIAYEIISNTLYYRLIISEMGKYLFFKDKVPFIPEKNV